MIKFQAMSLVIRLSRIGRKGEPKFRVVVAEKRSKRDGRPVAVLGSYTKNANSGENKIDRDKVSYWKSKGAEISPAVEKALSKS